MLARLIVLSKQASVVLGALAAVSAAYIALGLPVPMTEAAVKAKIEPIRQTLGDLKDSQTTIISDLSTVQRSVLRSERLALERALETASETAKVGLALRISQIQDELARIDRRDAEKRP